MLSLVDVLRRRAEREPERVAYIYLSDGESADVKITYGELDRRAMAIAGRLRAAGLVGERALLLYPPGLDYIAAFLGCLYAGTVAVPAYPPRNSRHQVRLEAICADARAAAILTTEAILAKLERKAGTDSALTALQWLALEAPDSEGWHNPAVGPNTLAFLQYTSGSTGTPKGVKLTHANLLANLELIAGGFEHTQESCGVVWLPPYHDMGLIGGILQPLYVGFPCVLMAPTAFIQKPVRWLQAISRYKATSSGGPSFAYDLCVKKVTPAELAELDLSQWSLAFTGAEPIRSDTLDRFAQTFAAAGFRHEAFYPCYGLAEATLFVSGGRKADLPVVAHVDREALADNRMVDAVAGEERTQALVSTGNNLPGQQIRVVAPGTLVPCSEGEVGEIWVAGPSIAAGYWNRSEESERTFGAFTAAGDGPFLRTGDLGVLRDGELFITGRLKDLIIIRGRNYYPQDLEQTAEESHHAVRSNASAAFAVTVDGETRLMLACEVGRRLPCPPQEVADAIRRAVALEFELQVHGVVLLREGAMPKTSSGKIQRHGCRDGLAAGELELVYASTVEQDTAVAGAAPQSNGAPDRTTLLLLNPEERRSMLERYVSNLVAGVLRMPAGRVELTRSLGALGLDSLAAVDLSGRLAHDLQVEISMVRLLQDPTVAELASEVLAALDAAPVSPMPAAAEVDGLSPASHGQRAMWLLHQLEPNSGAYHVGGAVRMRGALDLPALKAALQELVRRHESLRTTFSYREGQLLQQVSAEMLLAFTTVDALAWSDCELDDRLRENSLRPFDLESGPLLRLALFRRGAEEHLLLLVMHHIITDFWSLGVFLQELGVLYPAFAAGKQPMLPQPAVQYSDYVSWQSAMLAGPEGERLEWYWLNQLAGELPVLDLPTDHPRPAVQTYRGASEVLHIAPALTHKLTRLSRETGATLYMVLLAAYHVLLHRYAGQDEILVGSPAAARSRAEFTGLMGYLVNPLVLRADLSAQPSFRDLLAQVRQTVLDAMTHQNYPFALLVEKLQPERDLSRPPIFQTLFSLQKAQQDDRLTPFALGEQGPRLPLGDLELESYPLEQRIAQFDLALSMAEVEEGLLASFRYNADLFDHGTMERLAHHFENLLESIVVDPAHPVSELPLLTEAESTQLVVDWNSTELDYARSACLHQLFEQQAERTPDAISVAFEDRELTYGELNRRANQVAHRLQALGVGPEVLVGVYMQRSLEMLVGLLGILKAGGGYLPLDPAYPQDRLGFMLQDSGTAILLTQQHLAASFPHQGCTLLCLDVEPGIGQGPETNPECSAGPGNLAYVIYTSGSTGKPKGVMVPHRSVVNFFAGMDQTVGGDPGDTLLAVTSISFDISVLELFWPLSRGIKVVVLSEQAVLNATVPATTTGTKGMEFSLFYFANDEQQAAAEKYRLLVEGARFADTHDFSAVWIPERHFHQFGGLYPNPSVLASALAVITKRVQLRAGSVVLPLHNPVRVAEEWAAVDQLSRGRVGLAFASGWHADDFALLPENYEHRKEVLYRGIAEVQQFWKGESVTMEGGTGRHIPVRIFPQPVQAEIPVWVTSGGGAETFVRAGELGANLLTHLLGQTPEELQGKIAMYRQALARNGYDPASRKVTLMLHTFLGQDPQAVRETVRAPFRRYLRSSVDLIGGLARSSGMNADLDAMSEADMEALLDHAFDRYADTSALFGTPESCAPLVERLQAIGVDEVAALIDFGVDTDAVLDSLRYLDLLRQRWIPRSDFSLPAQAVRHQATHLQCTPSLMRMLADQESTLQSLSSLRSLMLGGEALPVSLAQQLRRQLPARLINMYGPTETTIWSATHEVAQVTGTVPIGRPIANTQFYIVDRQLRPVPVGVAGEILIGGDGVTRGYLGWPELTAQRFVTDRFSGSPGAMLYRTGDLGRYRPDGTIEFLGRLDHQVKLRGYRIELGEIETALGGHDAVKEAVVTVREETPGIKNLVAYVVPPAGKQAPSAAQLRAWLRDSLPDYMVPTLFVAMKALPLTPNGKVDRRALPAPQPQGNAGYVAPATLVEAKLTEIWAEVLGRGLISVDQNFFEIGGHSLAAARVVARIREVFQVAIPLRALFQSPTVAALARVVEHRGTQPSAADTIARVPRDGHLPLSFGQQRLWFLDQLDPGIPLYNEPLLAVSLHGDTDVEALAWGINEVLRRHEVLRTTYEVVGGQPVQVIHPERPLSLPVIDLSGTENPAATLQQLAAEEARCPFDLAAGPMFRATLFRLAPQEHVLCLARHHIVSDGWSTGVLMRELAALYTARLEGLPSPLAELPIQYVDFVHWQRASLEGEVLAEQMRYWKQQLAAMPVLDLPTDRPRPARQTYHGGVEGRSIPSSLVEGLRQLSREQHVTLFSTLLAAFKVLLCRYSGQADVAVGSPVANRSRTEIEGLIGFFVNTLVLRTDLTGLPSFAELLGRVQETVLQAQSHQDLPFEQMLEAVQPERDMSRPPLFQVMFTLQNAHLGTAQLPGLTLEPTQVHTGTAKFDLTLELMEGPDGITASMEYNTDLFDRSTIQRVLAQYHTLLEAVCADPLQAIATLPLLTPGEQQCQLVAWNATGAPTRQDACIHDLVAEQAARTPDAVALVFEGEAWTYRELLGRANQLARYLQRLGVGPETVVGLCVDRSPAMMICLLGILKAGGAYLPLDPQYPAERLAFMLTDSGAPVVLTQRGLVDKLPGSAARVICVDTDWAEISRESATAPDCSASPQNLGYVIYTSGSTGQPKGVMVPHTTVINFFAGMDQAVGGGPGDSLLAVTSISFDISVLELFWTLSQGMKVVLLSEQAVVEAAAPSPRKRHKELGFSLFYFANDDTGLPSDKYRLLTEGAKFADQHGFEAIWVPERHFHPFGGLYPNPSVLSAALAMSTERIALRAGSVVLPLHNPVRVAEEWSVVDNLSGGRVGIACASGWHANDFVFAPEAYLDRKAAMYRSIETIKQLWGGQAVMLEGGAGNQIPVEIYPKPVQKELPIWVTSAGGAETFERAGAIGANVLTHVLNQNVEDVARNIARYRESLLRHGHDPMAGRVTLMVHTFIGTDPDVVRETVRVPFRNYLRSSVGLFDSLIKSLGIQADVADMSQQDMDALLDFAFDRYYGSSALFGTPESCQAMVERLQDIGVDEIACLIDFGVESELVLDNLKHLDRLRQAVADTAEPDYSFQAQALRHQVTHLQGTPSLIRMLTTNEESLESLESLRVLLLGGEALPASLAATLQQRLRAKLINMYGPTETTVWSATYPVDGSEAAVPIGRPIANTQIYVVDQNMQVCPAGVPGEMLIGGAGVCRGYLGQPELTAERFIPNPFDPAAGRVYRTGDLARHRPDGTLEFLGRLDHQVKLRGYRIELGEIAAVLEQHREVEAAVAAVVTIEGDQQLVAYVVPATRQPAVTSDELRRFTQERLPRHMVPGTFVLLEALPLTPNGKVDRKALPAPHRMAADTHVAPANDVEAVVASIWAEVLHMERVSVHDSFFSLGGHSLLATQAVTLIREALQVDIPLRTLFETPTVAAVTDAILRNAADRERVEKTAAMLLSLSQLSDEDVDAMLRSRTSGKYAEVVS